MPESWADVFECKLGAIEGHEATMWLGVWQTARRRAEHVGARSLLAGQQNVQTVIAQHVR